jgi:hypothetical protein
LDKGVVMAKLGTVDWLEQTHGKVGLRDKLTMIAQGVRARAATQKRIKYNVKFRHCEVDDILPPDSAIAREAMSMCEIASETYLLHHCLRSYFWARLLDDGCQSFDDEAVFTAFMLHDMGLTDKHRLVGDHEQCFTIVGARMTQELAIKHQWSDKRAKLASNAIALHLNIVVDPCHGREAQMLRMGSGADVAGIGMDVLHSDQVSSVCAHYPRTGFKASMIKSTGQEAIERPQCRMAFLNKSLGFDKLIANAKVFGD